MLVPLLSGFGANANVVDDEGFTPLMRCCDQAEDLSAFPTLMLLTHNTAAVNNLDETALHLASKHKCECGCNGDGWYDHWDENEDDEEDDVDDDDIHQPLKMARQLIKSGIDVNAKTNDGETAYAFCLLGGRHSHGENVIKEARRRCKCS